MNRFLLLSSCTTTLHTFSFSVINGYLLLATGVTSSVAAVNGLVGVYRDL